MRQFARSITLAALAATIIPAALPSFAQDESAGAPADEEFVDPASTVSASDRQISAAQAIAEVERRRAARENALSLSRIDNMLSFEYDNMRGASEADVVKEASIRALLSAAGRVYFDDRVLVSRDLLEPYLRVYGERFVARRTVESRRILADGRNELDLRIGVDIDRFMKDLEEKHFLASPSVRPIVAVVLEETIDGVRDTQGRGRLSLEEALRNEEMRVETERIGGFDLAANASATTETLRAARDEADRGEVEVIVTGTLEVTSRGTKDILYDNFHFYTADARLQMIRVDTGEVVRTVNQSYASSATSPEAALAATFARLMPRCAGPLASGFLEDWRNTMLDLGDYRLLISGASQEQVESVFNLLKTLSPRVDTYLKSYFGEVAVVNVFYPGSKPGEIEDFLRAARVPQFQVRPADDRRFELRVH